MSIFNLTINGKQHQIDVVPDTPMLWVLREHLNLVGAKYGCGIGQCGACTIHLDGVAVRSCSVPVSSVGDKAVTTIEGLSPDGSHPLQEAWLAHDVPQCGYCQAGQIMNAAALLQKNPTQATKKSRGPCRGISVGAAPTSAYEQPSRRLLTWANPSSS